MYKNFDDVKKLTEENTQKLTEATQVISKGSQAIAAEIADFSKKSLEASTAAIQELSAVKSIETALELQAKNSKKAYEDAIAYSTKINELSINMFKDAFKPFEGLFASAQNQAKSNVAKATKVA